jgi:hypothetical protein
MGLSGCKLEELIHAWEHTHGKKQPIATARQLKFAARVLLEELPGLYQEALNAIISGAPLPWLFNYNRVAALRGIIANLSGAKRLEAMGLVLKSPLSVNDLRERLAIQYPKHTRKLTHDIDALREAIANAPVKLEALLGGVSTREVAPTEVIQTLREMEPLIHELASLIAEVRGELESTISVAPAFAKKS